MRRLIAAAALVAAPLMAQDVANARIAIFAPDQVIQASARGKKLFTEVEAKGKELQERLKTRADQLQAKEQQLKSTSLSEEGRAKLQRELQDGELEIRRMQEDSQKEFAKTQEKVMGAFQAEVGPIVKQLSEEWKLQMLFQYGRESAAFMLPIDEKWAMAFTSEVIKRYDAKFPEGAPMTKPAAPAAKPAAPAPKPAAAPAPAKKN
jgi:Skp family chaperone for outer membrane proteins